jgi:glycosyltransferase involved in cell wall biosynthesis
VDKINPLVSIGIPTYNRPEGLKRTLECITSQSYRNIEIIVSDNCSPNNESEKVVEEFINATSIRFFKQPENKGPGFNFKFVLEQAKGDYFMWAADDDFWDIDFIEKIMSVFRESPKKYIAVITEAQYISDSATKYEFFKEGAPFYDYYSNIKTDRLKHMLKYNYGNLVHAIFETAVLKRKNIIFAWNEIPFLLQVIEQGNLKVLPQVSFYKKVPYEVYLQAKWEKTGGVLPNSSVSLSYYSGLKSNFFYHHTAYRNIRMSVKTLDLSYLQRKRTLFLTFYYLAVHLFYFVIRFKPQP